MNSKLKIAAAGAVLGALMAMPAFAQPPGAGSAPPLASAVEQAKICKPRTETVERCERGRRMRCRYRVTLFCKRRFVGCRQVGTCFIPFKKRR